VLRVRVESGRSLLTFKGPVQPSPVKVREEIETVVGDGETMLRCLEQLGFAVWFRYQKYREEYALSDTIVAIDETPIGVFVEIEGDEHGIIEATRALGRQQVDFVLDSYRSLFIEHRRARGLPTTDMLFEDA
jgi:adenylate cyclase class 2